MAIKPVLFVYQQAVSATGKESFLIPEIKLYLNMYGVIDSIQKIARRINKPKEPWYCITEQWKLFSMLEGLIAGKNGLEIGGPTRLFKRWNWLPLYRTVGSLDNCNFSSSTRWEGTIQGGLTYNFDRRHKPGRQYILEITDLEPIKDESYDFVISSHVLEHTANPLKALSEIRRVLKNNGILLLILPHKEGAFDHKRLVTTIEHLLEDFKNDVSEADLTHLQEILACHDLTRDPSAGDFEAFNARSQCNAENRCLHHHVFDTKLAADLVNWLEMQILFVEPALPGDIFVVAKKVSLPIQNSPFLGAEAPHIATSPFVSDSIQAYKRQL